MIQNHHGPAGCVCPCLLVGWFNDQQVYLETGFPQDLVEGWDMDQEDKTLKCCADVDTGTDAEYKTFNYLV